jgi:hypothetical protein
MGKRRRMAWEPTTIYSPSFHVTLEVVEGYICALDFPRAVESRPERVV